MRVLSTLLTSLLFAACASAQTIPSEEWERADAKVWERAQAGVAQYAFVTLDDREIEAEANAAARARGLREWDREIMDNVVRATDLLKAEVFPEGKLGGIRVVTDRPNPSVAMVTIVVPDLQALRALLKHPRVKRVHDYYVTYRPAAQAVPDIRANRSFDTDAQARPPFGSYSLVAGQLQR